VPLQNTNSLHHHANSDGHRRIVVGSDAVSLGAESPEPFADEVDFFEDAPLSPAPPPEPPRQVTRRPDDIRPPSVRTFFDPVSPSHNTLEDRDAAHDVSSHDYSRQPEVWGHPTTIAFNK